MELPQLPSIKLEKVSSVSLADVVATMEMFVVEARKVLRPTPLSVQLQNMNNDYRYIKIRVKKDGGLQSWSEDLIDMVDKQYEQPTREIVEGMKSLNLIHSIKRKSK